jgi:aryl-alcohol dehydrogenase-like predicted oxidoreductase
MERRPFGRTGLEVSVIGMGCSRLGSIWQGRSELESHAALVEALDSGINYFDTADVYGRGRSEKILGRTLGRHRERIVIASKCGFIRTPTAAFNAMLSDRRLPTLQRSLGLLRTRRCYSSEYLARAVESTLRRLRTDYLDVLMLHSPPTSVLLSERIPAVLDALKEAGKIRFWGISARSVSDGLIALQMDGIDCLQIELNACDSTARRELLPQARQGGVAVVARQPFGSGDLLARASRAGMDRDLAVAACLRFALEIEGIASVIAGMSRPEHVAQNVRAIDERPVARSDLEQLQDLCVRDRS